MRTTASQNSPGLQRLVNRTFDFAVAIVRFSREFRSSPEGRHIAGQLLRSGTSVAANYRAARRARSRREFVAKVGVVIEECDETLFWLELLDRLGLGPEGTRANLTREANELTALFVVTRHRARQALKSV